MNGEDMNFEKFEDESSVYELAEGIESDGARPFVLRLLKGTLLFDCPSNMVSASRKLSCPSVSLNSLFVAF